ncbi:hypothetical protein M5689_001070 [Euphorbia peplus]|nr:hypothetical protein M5689_001070 [Euphorbia peplus]
MGFRARDLFFTSGENDNVIPQSNTSRAPVTDTGTGSDRVIERSDSGVVAAGPRLAWKLVTLPFSVISGGFRVGFGCCGTRFMGCWWDIVVFAWYGWVGWEEWGGFGCSEGGDGVCGGF